MKISQMVIIMIKLVLWHIQYDDAPLMLFSISNDSTSPVKVKRAAREHINIVLSNISF